MIEFLDDLCKLKEINKEFWEKTKVVWSDKFIDSISDAYSKRSNKCQSLEGLRSHLLSLGLLKGYVKPQSKVKETKEEESKEYKSILMSNATASDVSELNKEFFEMALSFYQLFKRNSEQVLDVEWKHLKNVKANSFVDPIRLLIQQDNRTVQDLRDVWTFLKNDSFWMPNIQSSKKLREKFDQLITKAKNQNNGKSNKSFSEEANKFFAENDTDYANY